ncbi:MAG: S41 family peptidase [Lautropia sp.]|nr:S41 family peptidase [Lautropia sp.]
MNKATNLSILALCAGLLTACGGGPAGRQTAAPPVDPVIGHSDQHANLCAPENPLARGASGHLLDGYRVGSVETEQRFVRAYMNEAYLWYREMPEVNPAAPRYRRSPFQEAITSYFQDLRTQALSATDKPKDRFSFATSTMEWKALSEAGVQHGYGADIAVLSGTPPRDLRVALVHEGTPAAVQQLSRGDRLLTLRTPGGRRIDVVNTTDPAEIEEMTRLIFEPRDGEQVQMEFGRAGGDVVSAGLKAGEYEQLSVHTARSIETPQGDEVGYLVVKSFNLPLEGQLQKALTALKDKGVKDVVLDLRYNGGGYLYQSAQLGYMLADPSLTQGRVFERLQYNDKRSEDSGRSDSTIRFLSTATGREGTGTRAGAALPNLGLRRLYVLTGADTCSASESLINGLRGVDMEVVLIGQTTCGKPYGFTARDNCGMSYFPIEFVGVNAKGFGDFDDGFTPDCVVPDDFGHQLGNAQEGLLAAALYHRQHGVCPVGTQGVTKSLMSAAPGAVVPKLVRGPLHTSKFLLP